MTVKCQVIKIAKDSITRDSIVKVTLFKLTNLVASGVKMVVATTRMVVVIARSKVLTMMVRFSITSELIVVALQTCFAVVGFVVVVGFFGFD